MGDEILCPASFLLAARTRVEPEKASLEFCDTDSGKHLVRKMCAKSFLDAV
jgi:hypothetical protein